MEEDVSELLGTEERLEQFAEEYCQLPVLWSKDNVDFKCKNARATALRRLARELGRGGPGAGRRMARVACVFRSRLQQEVLSACAEAALLGGAEGGSWEAARRLLPAWARRAAACLSLLPAGLAPQENIAAPVPTTAPPNTTKQNKPAGATSGAGPAAGERAAGGAAAAVAAAASSALARRVVRGMRRAARAGCALGSRAAAARVAGELGEDATGVHTLWTSLQRACVHKLRARVWRCDAGPPLAALEWAVVDLVLTYGGSMLNTLHYQHYKPLRGLLGVFHLVQRFGLEPLPGESPPSPALWRQAADWYSRDRGRAVMSALALQRRWYELRADTRRRLQAAWRRRPAPPPEPPPEPDARDKVLALHEAIARRYPHVVTETLPNWTYMLQTNQLAPPTNERGPVPGEAAQTGASTDSDPDVPEDDGVIVIEDEKPKVFNADKTKARKSDSKVEMVQAQFGFQEIEKSACKPKDLIVGNFEITDSDDNNDLKVQKNAAPVKLETKTKPACKPKDLIVGDFEITDSDDNNDLKVRKNADPVKSDPETKDLLNANFKVTDSDGDLQIDESRDWSENVIEALQKLNPRTVQATIVFSSDEDDAPNDVSETKRTDNIKTENVAGTKESKNNANVKRESTKKDADASSKTKSCVKTGNNCKDVNESHTSISLKAVKRRSDSSDSDDGILVIDDCKEEENQNLKDRITASIEEEMFKHTSNGSSSKDEVKSRVDNSTVKLPSEEDLNSKAKFPSHQNPILSKLLTSKQEHSDVFKRFQAITNKGKDIHCKSLTAESVAKRDFNDVATTSKINEYAMNIRNELLEQSVSASEEENDFEGGIDPKLLIYPVVLLTRLEDHPKPPPESPKPNIYASQTPKLSSKLLASKRHIEALSTLSETFFSIKRNIEQLKLCKPCVVMMAKLEKTGGKKSRVSKRVELPDIEEVRRNNKRMLTAQVAPLAHQRSAGARWDARGEGGAPSAEELQRMLDEFVGERPSHAVCKNRNSDARSAARCDCGHGSCLSRALAAPPADTAAAQLQTRLLRRAASHAKRRPKISSGKDRNRNRKKKQELSRSPAAPAPARRSPSPYDAERAAREWLREKNFAAEKFGVKPRCFKKKPAGSAALDAATITPLPAPAPAPAPQASAALPKPLADRATLTLNILHTDTQRQNTSGCARRPSLGRTPPEPRLRVEVPSGITVTPVRAQNGVAYLPLSEDNLIREAQNQPIFKLTPDLFNVDAVADINKKLEDLASNDRPEASAEATFSPVITSVQSLAPEERSSKPDGRQFYWLAKKTSDDGVPTPTALTLTGGRLKTQTVPKIVVNKSQLKTLPFQPPAPPQARSLLKTQQTTTVSDVNPHLNIESDSVTTKNTPPWHSRPTILNQTNAVPTNNFLQVGPAGLMLNNASNQLIPGVSQASQDDASRAQLGLQVNSVYSGPSLASSLQNAPWIVTTVQPATPAIVVGPPSTISQMTFENLANPCGLNLNPSALQVNSVQTGTSQAQPMLSGVQVGSHLQLVLTPQQISALQPGQQIAVVQAGQQMPVQLNWDANALQINSVRSVSAKTAGTADAALANRQVGASQDRLGTVLQVNSVQAGSLKRPQPDVPLTDEGQLSGLKPSPKVSSPQAGTLPAGPQVSVPRVVAHAGPSADKRKKEAAHANDVFNESDWPGLPPPPAVEARAWVAGPTARDRSRLAVLAATRPCWSVARHLVLGEARALPPRSACAVYALKPLTRLLLPDDEEPGPTEPKQSKPSEPPAAPRPWLKVKAFAKMTDDGQKVASQPDPEPGPEPAGVTGVAGAVGAAGARAGGGRGRALPRVLLADTAYLKLCDAPLAYAKVLTPLSGLRECGAALLRGAPLYLYSPHAATLAPLSGELDAKGTAIVLTGPEDMSDALGALALMLNPSDVAPDSPTSPPPADPPADPLADPPADPAADPPVNLFVDLPEPESLPSKQSKQNYKLVLPPKVLNPQNSGDVSVEAVRVSSDPNKQTYHLILNHLQSESAVRPGGAGEARPLGGEGEAEEGVVDLSSDEELSV